MAVVEIVADAVSDEICRRRNGKQQRRHGGRSVQLPDWVMNKSNGEVLLLLRGSLKRSHVRRGDLST